MKDDEYRREKQEEYRRDAAEEAAAMACCSDEWEQCRGSSEGYTDGTKYFTITRRLWRKGSFSDMITTPDRAPDIYISGGGCKVEVYERSVYYSSRGRLWSKRDFVTNAEAEKAARKYIKEAIEEWKMMNENEGV